MSENARPIVASKIVEKIHEYHGLALKHAEAATVYAMAVGELLIYAKKYHSHGGFSIIKNAITVPERTLNNYMRLAMAFKEDSGQTLLDHKMSISAETAENIEKVIDGRTLTQLYNDWGILKIANSIKERGPEEKPKKVSKAKQEEFERDLTRQAWDIILRKLNGEMEKLSFVHLAVPEREAILSCLDDARKEIARSIK